LWIFSVQLNPPEHHLDLAPIRPLHEEVDGHTQLEGLVAALETLPDQVRGGTALYDTTLAAFRHVQESYADDKVNSVVLLTDGRDEDNPEGIDRDELLDALRDEFDPDAPVPIITIGFGPDADMEALQDISEATGTRAYQAEDPEDIDEVFARAMLERICRPDC
jgi:Ca-activated chloride channel homolog